MDTPVCWRTDPTVEAGHDRAALEVAGKIDGVRARRGVAGQVDALVIAQELLAVGEMEIVARHRSHHLASKRLSAADASSSVGSRLDAHGSAWRASSIHEKDHASNCAMRGPQQGVSGPIAQTALCEKRRCWEGANSAVSSVSNYRYVDLRRYLGL